MTHYTIKYRTSSSDIVYMNNIESGASLIKPLFLDTMANPVTKIDDESWGKSCEGLLMFIQWQRCLRFFDHRQMIHRIKTLNIELMKLGSAYLLPSRLHSWSTFPLPTEPSSRYWWGHLKLEQQVDREPIKREQLVTYDVQAIVWNDALTWVSFMQQRLQQVSLA